jgi:hypothetical protein
MQDARLRALSDEQLDVATADAWTPAAGRI